MITLVGDFGCQTLFEGKRLGKKGADVNSTSGTYDYARTLRFTTLGGLLVGPTLHFWYGFLAVRFPGAGLAPVVKRLAFDQLGFAPLFIPTFMASSMVLEGASWSQVHDHVNKEYFSALKANYALWVPSNGINFYFMPLRFQVLFSNLTGVAWNIYLSFSLHRNRNRKNP